MGRMPREGSTGSEGHPLIAAVRSGGAVERWSGGDHGGALRLECHDSTRVLQY